VKRDSGNLTCLPAGYGQVAENATFRNAILKGFISLSSFGAGHEDGAAIR
jgi:hypothetical protein